MEIPRRSGVLKAKFLEAMYENKLEFTGWRGGGGLQNKQPSVGGMDIFWNCTINAQFPFFRLFQGKRRL